MNINRLIKELKKGNNPEKNLEQVTASFCWRAAETGLWQTVAFIYGKL